MRFKMAWLEQSTRWVLTCLAVLSACAIVVSTGCAASWGCGSRVKRHVVVTSGAVRVMAYHEDTNPAGPQTSSWWFSNHPPGPTRWFIFWRPMWQPSSAVSIYIVPFWIPCLVFALPATLLWGIRFAKNRNEHKETPNQASHATSEPAPNAASSSREGCR